MKGISEQSPDFQTGLEMAIDVTNTLRKNPGRWAAVHPRNYAKKPGYFHPRLNSGFMAIYLEFMNSPQPNKVEIDCILSTWMICKNLVPTFYVGQEFAEALVCTQPPENLVMRDLEWPFEGMVFVLPEKFQRDYFGALVPFIRVARIPTGIQQPPDLIRKAYSAHRGFGIQASEFGQVGVIITATVMEQGRPVDYSGSFPDTDSLGTMMDGKTYEKFFQNQEQALALGITDLGSNENDLALLKKIISLVGHLLLAMNAVPEQIEPPKVVWPLKEKVQRKIPRQNWTWTPHFLGWQYRWQKEKGSVEGAHASPRLHPRRGHWRHQPHGPGRTQKKIIWIKPMLIGATTKDKNDT